MSPQPREGPGEDGLSSSMLSVLNNQERIDCLRRMLSGFSHRYRNLLNGIKMSLYLFRREVKGSVPTYWNELERTYQDIERLIDHLQTIYRPMNVSMVRSPLGPLIADLTPRWQSWLQAQGRMLELDPPGQDLPGDFDPMQMGSGLDALVAWRAETGDPRWQPRLSWRMTDGFFEVRWDDAWVKSLATPLNGRAGPSPCSDASRRVDCLVLPLLARIVAAHGGRLDSTREPSLRLRLRWPRFQSSVAGP
jgi:hypothetical protein